MKKFIRWLEGWLPTVWGLMWVVIITLTSFVVLSLLVKWVLVILLGGN